ncbi:hypothetical protein HMI54_012935, partial [Coelomomyces lativittatus]
MEVPRIGSQFQMNETFNASLENFSTSGCPPSSQVLNFKLAHPQVCNGFPNVKKNEDVTQIESSCKRKCPDCDHWHNCSSRSLIFNGSTSPVLHHKNVHVNCHSNPFPSETRLPFTKEHPLQDRDSLHPSKASTTKSVLGLSHPPVSFRENVHIHCNVNNPAPVMPPNVTKNYPLQNRDPFYPTDASSTINSLGLSHPPLSFRENVHLNCNSNKLPSLTRPTLTKKPPLQNRDSFYTSSSNSLIGVSNSSTLPISLPSRFTSS